MHHKARFSVLKGWLPSSSIIAIVMCAADLTYSRLWFAVEPSALIVYYV